MAFDAPRAIGLCIPLSCKPGSLAPLQEALDVEHTHGRRFNLQRQPSRKKSKDLPLIHNSRAQCRDECELRAPLDCARHVSQDRCSTPLIASRLFWRRVLIFLRPTVRKRSDMVSRCGEPAPGGRRGRLHGRWAPHSRTNMDQKSNGPKKQNPRRSPAGGLGKTTPSGVDDQK